MRIKTLGLSVLLLGVSSLLIGCNTNNSITKDAMKINNNMTVVIENENDTELNILQGRNDYIQDNIYYSGNVCSWSVFYSELRKGYLWIYECKWLFSCDWIIDCNCHKDADNNYRVWILNLNNNKWELMCYVSWNERSVSPSQDLSYYIANIGQDTLNPSCNNILSSSIEFLK